MSNFEHRFLDEFHIGTYFLQKNARTDSDVKDMRNCGIDLVFGIDNDRNLLDLFYKYGVCAVVSGIVPGWFGRNGDNAGQMSRTCKKEDYINGIQAFADHPAIVGIDIGDEPSSKDFHYYGEIVQLMQQLLPSKFHYLNIYPSYGMLATNNQAQRQKELGVASYYEYIESYCKNVPLPYLSVDHYVYTSEKNLFFSDLSIAASFCKANNKKLFVVLQVNSREKEIFLTEEQLCFQAFSAMAYGATTISWACYSEGWWHNQVLDADGNKTEQYQKLKKVNYKVLSLVKGYVKYKWIDTERIDSGCTADFDVFKAISATKDILLGKFENGNGKKAVFISLTDYKPFITCTLSFKLDDEKQVWLYKTDRIEKIPFDVDGVYRVTLNNTEACYITTE